MAATEVAIAKGVATVASDKRGRIAIASLIAAILMIFMMPIIVYMGITSNMKDLGIDADAAVESIVANMSDEEIGKLTHLEDVNKAITKEFKDRDMAKNANRAFALYCCALYDIEPTDSDFITHIADCFEQATDNDSLLSLINSTFGVSLEKEEFNNLMSVISSTIIDLDIPGDKTNEGLVEWAKFAYDNQWGYVWGSHGKVLTEKELNRLKSVFGSHVTEKEEYIRNNWLGRRTSDCVGLIKGYGWYDNDTGTIKYGTNGMRDVTADGMYVAATEKGPMSTMPDIPGLAVWHQGHIGVYVGNGYVIHAANTYAGVIKTPITSSGWTHWLKVPYINYVESETEQI